MFLISEISGNISDFKPHRVDSVEGFLSRAPARARTHTHVQMNQCSEPDCSPAAETSNKWALIGRWPTSSSLIGSGGANVER